MRPKAFASPKYLADLSELVYQRRGGRLGAGLRETAREIGISAATLSRVERGGVPDIDSFRKLCLWLDKSADELLGLRKGNS